MLAFNALTFFFGVGLTVPPPMAENLTSIFQQFCLETKGDRAAFDAQINSATGLVKISAPSLFSGLEFNRRWKVGTIELSFTDAPPPTRRECAVTASTRGEFDGQAIAAKVSKVAGTVLQQSDRNRWIGRTLSGETLLVINRVVPDGFGGVEIILQP